MHYYAFFILLMASGAGGEIEIGPTPDTSTSGFGRRRTATYIRRNADFANRST